MIPDKFYGLVILDKPDLQNESLNIGVEVVSSINPKQQEAEALYVNWCYKDEIEKEKKEKQIEKCGDKLYDGILSGISGHDNFDKIFKTLKNKTRKLKKYKSFSKQYLFIFSDLYATTNMLEKALEEMCNICNLANPKFVEIYVLVPGALYVFDITNNITYVSKIDSNMQFLQSRSARDMVVQGENQETDSHN